MVGYPDPDQVLTLSGSRFVDGNIIVINRGTLILDHADTRVNGNISLMHEGRMTVTGGSFTVVQEYIYQHGVVITGASELAFSDLRIGGSGQSFSIAAVDSSRYRFDRCRIEDGFITHGLLGKAEAEIRDCTVPGEFLCFGQTSVDIRRSDLALIWLVLPESSLVDLALPQGDFVSGFRFQDGDPGIEGIPYTMTVDSSSNILWGLISMSGSQACFRETDFRSVGLMFNRPDSIAVSHLQNEIRYIDETLDIPDRTLRFIDSGVGAWNLYPSQSSIVTVDRCLFGELLAQDQSKVWILNSICDGTGGYLGAQQNSTLIVGGSLVQSQMIVRQSAVCIGISSSFMGSQVDADDFGVLLLANTFTAVEPETHGAGVIIEGFCPYVQGTTGDRIGVVGTARILAGPDNPISLTGYAVSASAGPGTSPWSTLDGFHSIPVRQDTLAVWTTDGFPPGNYGLRLTIHHNYGDSIAIDSWARLDPGTPVFDQPGIQVPEEWTLGPNFPNPFNAATTLCYSVPEPAVVSLKVYDSSGRIVAVLHDGWREPGSFRSVFNAADLPSGVYAVRLQSPKTSRTTKVLLLK